MQHAKIIIIVPYYHAAYGDIGKRYVKIYWISFVHCPAFFFWSSSWSTTGHPNWMKYRCLWNTNAPLPQHDLWPTDLKINRDHLLIKGYLPTKFEVSGAKPSWVISCTRLRATDIPTDRPTYRPTDRCNAICPSFFKGGHNKYKILSRINYSSTSETSLLSSGFDPPNRILANQRLHLGWIKSCHIDF